MKLKIHPLFFIFGLYFAITGKVFLFLTIALTALIHEYGHGCALFKLGYKMNNISLMPYGAVLNCNIDGISYKDEIIVALAGPLLNLFVATFFIALWWIYPPIYTYTDTVVMCNLSVALVNFLPCYPLDGGRILCDTLSLYIKQKTAELIVKILGIIFSLVIFALFVYSIFIKNINFSLLFFALFMLIGATKKKRENTFIKIFFGRDFSKCIVKECKNIVVSENILLKNLMPYIDCNNYFTIDIVKNNGNIKKLGIEKSEKLLSSYRLYDKIGEIEKSL